MKAFTLTSPGVTEMLSLPIPKPKPDEVLVKVLATSMNRRDYWITQGLYPGIKNFPVILGSDACGLVEKVGEKVDAKLLGKLVVLNPVEGWGNDDQVQSNDFNILGMPRNGTFANYVVVLATKVVEAPKHLTIQQAASIGVASHTAYRALFTKGGLKRGELVLINGIGSGVAQFAAQFAVAYGARVYITSSKEQKIESAVKKLGVRGGVVCADKWAAKAVKLAGAKFDLVLDGSGGDILSESIAAAKNGGRVVTYGATSGLVNSFPIQHIFLRQISLIGCTAGTDKDFNWMVQLINENKIVPQVDAVYPFESMAEAMLRLKSGDQQGKIVISIASSKV